MAIRATRTLVLHVSTSSAGIALAIALASVASQADVQVATALPTDIQAAINNQCPEPANQGSDIGCRIVLPCGRWSASSFPAGNPTGTMISINNKENVRISGCGMNGTTITWDPGSGSAGAASRLLSIEGTSRWITIEDLKLEIDCASGCSSFVTQVGYVAGGIQDVTFERVHFHARDPNGTTIGPQPTGLNIGTFGSPAKNIHAYASNFHSTGYGLSATDCDSCWFEGNWFGAITDSTRTAYALANKVDGFGVRFANNTFDMAKVDGITAQVGLYLRSSTNAQNTTTASTAQVVGNSFINLQDSVSGQPAQRAIWVYRYNGANIEGNTFACGGTASSCTPRAIDFLDQTACPSGTGFCNQHNLIASNTFDRIRDSNATPDTGSQCPILLPAMSNANIKNVVHGNFFRLGSGSAVGANGICGANETQNEDWDNKVVIVP